MSIAASRPATSAPPAAATRRRATAWLCTAAAAGAALALRYGLSAGADPAEGWRLAARYTARLSFPLFLLVYTARPWQRLAPSAAARAVLRVRRSLGLAFATAHSIHLGALSTFFLVSAKRPDPLTVVVGGGAYLTLFAMAATSSDAAVRRLGRSWGRLHTFGMHYLWFVFAFSYGTRTLQRDIWYAPFFAAALAALGLRIAAARSRRVPNCHTGLQTPVL